MLQKKLMNGMSKLPRIILSKFLYHVGDLVSKFLYFNCFSWLYPLYRKFMIWSSELDKDNVIWKNKKYE